MGRQGPLTSQGLGRSPYDIVVPGEGEADPLEPPQLYDDRGRPVNPLTRQMNRDIIRSHNEVMQVIGVAEPDNVMSEPQKLAATQKAYENETGMWLLSAGRFATASSVWGLVGMRHRILLYKQYSHIPLLELWSRERQQRSLTAMVLGGYPAFVAHAAIIYSRMQWPGHRRILNYGYSKRIYDALLAWIDLHLSMFAILQQLDLIPARLWLPHPTFFIPCSPTSPIAAPAPPTALTPAEVAKWVGSLALNAAPLLGIYACQRVFTAVRPHIRHYFRSRLPTPPLLYSPKATIRDARAVAREPRVPPPEAQPATPAQSPAPPPEDAAPEVQPELNAAGFPTTSQMRPRDEPRGHPEPINLAPLEGGPPARASPAPPARVRRQSTISTTRPMAAGFTGTGEPYGSDDEDNSGDMMSTTLISFDVEATDATTDPPPGQWSAELRPNAAAAEGNGGGGGGAQGSGRPQRTPTYRSTALTRLPSTLAADIFSHLTTWVLGAPVEAVAFRWFARSFAAARGLSTAGMYPVWGLSGLTRHAFANFAGITLLNFFTQFDMWAAVYGVASSLFFFTEEEWAYFDREEDQGLGEGDGLRIGTMNI